MTGGAELIDPISVKWSKGTASATASRSETIVSREYASTSRSDSPVPRISNLMSWWRLANRSYQARTGARVYTRVLERLCRYVLRPPFAQERLQRRGDGRVALELKRAWHDGTRELVFEPLEFLERLAAMTPRPETNLLICHGVLAPRARWRGRVVVYGRMAQEPTAALAPAPDGAREQTKPRSRTWAALMHRAFGIDVLACAQCGGRLRLIATLHDPAVIRKILAHLPLCHSGQSPASPHASLAPPHPDRLLEGAADAVVPSRRDVAARLTRRSVWPSMSLTRAGSLDPQGGR